MLCFQLQHLIHWSHIPSQCFQSFSVTSSTSMYLIPRKCQLFGGRIWLYSSVDLTGNLIMIEKLVSGGDLNRGPPNLQCSIIHSTIIQQIRSRHRHHTMNGLFFVESFRVCPHRDCTHLGYYKHTFSIYQSRSSFALLQDNLELYKSKIQFIRTNSQPSIWVQNVFSTKSCNFQYF